MTLHIYRSTDDDAPTMTAAAGSAIAVLDACLVTGYGTKEGAGWTKEVVDAATYQALYTQGASGTKPRKKLHVKDDASTSGTAHILCCDACTISASPTLTNPFGGYGTATYPTYLTKADQEKGGSAKWLILATDRYVYMLTKRSIWGDTGWQFAFFGDLSSVYSGDKGMFATVGYTAQTVGAIGMSSPNKELCIYCGVFGNTDGFYNPTLYNMRSLFGQESNRGVSMVPKGSYASGLVLTPLLISDSYRLRGFLPGMFRTVSTLPYFSWYMIKDEYELATEDGRTLLTIRFGGDITSEPPIGRIFLDITEAV